jgi:hypothetical protein
MVQPTGTRLSRRPAHTGEPPHGLDPRLRLAAGGVVVVLVLVWLLFLPPFGLLRGGDGWRDGGDDLVRRRGDAPKPPDGFALASPYYEIRSKQDRENGPSALTVPLGDGKGGRGLALFTWENGEWRRLASAQLADGGKSVKAELERVPANVVAMRRTPPAFVIQAILPPGTAPHPDGDKGITTRAPFDFVPSPDGTLLGTPSSGTGDDAIALVPVIRATAGAEAEAVNAILSSDQIREAHIASLLRLVRDQKLDGIDLEYTAVDPSLGSAFTAFVSALAEQLHQTGQTLTIAVPIPRREGNAWSTLGYDLKEIGRLADYTRIPTERDQSLYRRTVRDALGFITGQVEPKKVILTLSPMAAEKSEAGIRTLTAQEALSIAAQFSVRDADKLSAGVDALVVADNLNREGAGAGGLFWDPSAAAVSFVYQSGDALRTVWIENVYSAAFKLELVQQRGLGGVAVDDAYDALGMANIWPAIEQYRTGQLTLLQPNPGWLKPEWLIDGKRYEFAKAQFTWKTPELGDHTVSIIVGDGVMKVLASQRVTVRQAAAPAPSPTPGRSPTASPTPGR